MSSRKSLILVLAVAVGLMGIALAFNHVDRIQPQEKKTTLDKLPPAVKETLIKLAGSNMIREIEEVTKGKVKAYEAEWIENGKEVEVLIAEDGALLRKGIEKPDADKDDEAEDDDDAEEEEEVELEEIFVVEIDFSEAPEAVRAAAIAELGSEESLKIEKLWGEEEPYYEVDKETSEGCEIIIRISADGTLLGRCETREIAFESLPAAVSGAILTMVEKEKIEEVEEVSENALKFYDFEFVQGDSEIKFRLAADGKLVAKFVESEGEAEDDDER